MMKSKLSEEKIKPTHRNFLARYRISPHCTTGIASCELLMKRHLRTKLDLLQKNKSGTNEVVFKERDRVWMRNYRRQQKWVQGEILGKIGLTMY